MSGYAICTGNCINCDKMMQFNPIKVPSLRINGVKQPLCESCFNKWNEIHRTRKGLPKIELDPEAYSHCREEELE